MTDPLARVPGIWRPFLAVAFNGVSGRLYPANPGLNWHADPNKKRRRKARQAAQRRNR